MTSNSLLCLGNSFKMLKGSDPTGIRNDTETDVRMTARQFIKPTFQPINTIHDGLFMKRSLLVVGMNRGNFQQINHHQEQQSSGTCKSMACRSLMAVHTGASMSMYLFFFHPRSATCEKNRKSSRKNVNFKNSCKF